MTWVKLDDHFDEHPKLAQAGPLGMALQVAALCYCNRNLTDGFVPRSVASRLLSLETSDANGKPMKLAATWEAELFGGGWEIEAEHVVDRMLESGLWDQAPGGYTIHDYHEFQPSKAEVMAERAKVAERVRKHRERRNAVTPTVTNVVGNTVSNGPPVPVPVPVPKDLDLTPMPEETVRATVYTDEFEAFWRAFPVREGKRKAFANFKEAKKRATVAEIMAGVGRYKAVLAADPERKAKWPEGWLNGDRWLDEFSSGTDRDPRADLPSAAEVLDAG